MPARQQCLEQRQSDCVIVTASNGSRPQPRRDTVQRSQKKAGDDMMTSNNQDHSTAHQSMVINPLSQGMFKPRTDMRTRDIVNQAVASLPTAGLQGAAEFLETMNVPAEIAVRALVYPNRRRIY